MSLLYGSSVKTEGQIKHKLAQVRFRHLKQEIRTGLSKRPENCCHNGVLASPSVRVHLCLLSTDGVYDVCDANHGGLDKAAKCPLFECKNSKESIKGDFLSFVRTADIVDVASAYPDMAALSWVLEDDSGSVIPDEDEPENPNPGLGVYRSYPVVLPGDPLYSSHRSYWVKDPGTLLERDPMNPSTCWVL